MDPNNPSPHVELDDLIIIERGILGKSAYRVTSDVLHIRLQNIDNGFEHEAAFESLNEVKDFIHLHNHQHISLS